MTDDDLGTLRWFGESWGAPVCDPRAQVRAPVGAVCIGHDHLHSARSSFIEYGDQGVTMPYLGGYALPGGVVYHLDCWLHEIGVDRLAEPGR